jgi:hypothetical protein
MCREALEKLRADPQWKDVQLLPMEMTPVRNAMIEVRERQASFAYFVIILLLLGLAVPILDRFGRAAAVVFFVVLVWALEMFYRYIQRVRIHNIGKWWAKPR